jgi:ribulose kinase
LPVFDPGLWGPFEDVVGASAWALEAGQTSTGGTVHWLLDKLGGGLPTNAERYPAAAAATPAGAEGLILLDFWQGSRTPLRDPLARGTSLRPDATT